LPEKGEAREKIKCGQHSLPRQKVKQPVICATATSVQVQTGVPLGPGSMAQTRYQAP
jgi:hypothetical protein